MREMMLTIGAEKKTLSRSDFRKDENEENNELTTAQKRGTIKRNNHKFSTNGKI